MGTQTNSTKIDFLISSYRLSRLQSACRDAVRTKYSKELADSKTNLLNQLRAQSLVICRMSTLAVSMRPHIPVLGLQGNLSAGGAAWERRPGRDKLLSQERSPMFKESRSIRNREECQDQADNHWSILPKLGSQSYRHRGRPMVAAWIRPSTPD